MKGLYNYQAFSLCFFLGTLLSWNTSFLCEQEAWLLTAPKLKSHSFYHWRDCGFFCPEGRVHIGLTWVGVGQL